MRRRRWIRLGTSVFSRRLVGRRVVACRARKKSGRYGASALKNQATWVTVAKSQVRSRSWQRSISGRIGSRSCLAAFPRNASQRAKCNGWNVRHSTTASRENRPTNDLDQMKAKAHQTSVVHALFLPRRVSWAPSRQIQIARRSETLPARRISVGVYESDSMSSLVR